MPPAPVYRLRYYSDGPSGSRSAGEIAPENRADGASVSPREGGQQ